MDNQTPFLVLLCRPGFEQDLEAEISDRIGANVTSISDIAGIVIIKTAIDLSLSVDNVIFARQLFWATTAPFVIDSANRADPICEAAAISLQSLFGATMCSTLMWELVDSNEGKELTRSAKSLSRPVLTRLKKGNILWNSGKGPKTAPTLHIVPLPNNSFCVGASLPGMHSIFPGGIEHLKTPVAAPSRSLLKLEEAFKTFKVSGVLPPEFTAVDLGAAPGGWSYYLIEQGGIVTAIDNANLKFEHSNLTHLRTNALTYQPPHTIDLMVCDMVEKPLLIAELVKRWVESKWCRQVIVNLKLPMRHRYESLKCCHEILYPVASHSNMSIKTKHLYHDRKEVTVMMWPMSVPLS